MRKKQILYRKLISIKAAVLFLFKGAEKWSSAIHNGWYRIFISQSMRDIEYFSLIKHILKVVIVWKKTLHWDNIDMDIWQKKAINSLMLKYANSRSRKKYIDRQID